MRPGIIGTFTARFELLIPEVTMTRGGYSFVTDDGNGSKVGVPATFV
jgi:hypothetical protein